MNPDNLKDPSGVGLLRLPNEILLEIFQQLDSGDPGILAISTLCKRLHYVALPIYLAAHGIPDASALASQELILSPTQLDILAALQTSLFIHSLKHISCSFSLNSARRDYSTRDVDNFLGHIRRLAAFLSILQGVDQVTLNFKDVNFWAMDESLSILEAWAPTASTLLDVVLEKGCTTLNVEGGMFIVHPSQFPLKPGPKVIAKRRSVIFDVGRRIGSAFAGRSDTQKIPESGKSRAALRTFNIRSRVLLLHPCYSWTMTALNTSPNLVSLSIRVDIPERSWDEILSNIHVPTLENLTIDLRCRIRAATFDQFLARHPRVSTLSLGRDLLPLTEEGVASNGRLPNLRHLFASPTYVRFLMINQCAPTMQTLRLLVKVASNAIFKAAEINDVLALCHPRMERVHLTLVIIVDYVSSHWTGFFPDEETVPRKNRPPDSLQYARVLELVSTCPSDAFETLALRLLPSFPALYALSFSHCLGKGSDAAAFVSRVKQACPQIERVTLDDETYDAVS
ncbi:hypothetical protein DFH09DRAFT_423156 [Mycena vulgaris]|nr:hypothetical protein DFH09DRAFT_423156 [Mycena vulgaris]